MLTDRLRSGPSQMGDLSGLGSSRQRPETQEKGPDSFAALVDKKTKQAEGQPRALQKPTNGQNEAGSRMDKDLSVKRKNSDERSEKSARNAEEDSKERIDSKEQRPEKSEEKHLTGKAKKQNLSQRQKVMQEFMDSAESEFSIPPERLVGAMAKLDDKQMLKAPEETASQIISELKLPPEAADKLEARYVQMLTKLSEIENRRPERMLEPTGEQLAWLQASGGLAGMGAIASLKQGSDGQPSMLSVKDKRMMLNDSIHHLSEKFFLNGSEAISSDSGQGPLSKMDSQSMSGQSNQLNPMLTNDGEFAIAGMEEQKVPVDFNMNHQLPGLNGQIKMSNEGYQDLATRMATLGAAAGVLGQAIKNDPRNRAAMNMEQAMSPQAMDLQAGGAASLSMLAQAGGSQLAGEGSMSSFSEGSGKDSLDLGSSGKGSASGDFFAQPQAEFSPLLNSKLGVTAGAAGAATTVVRSPESSQNIQQLMNQAQYVIKKGGGEAIVKLNPEGLGEVHLRVQVNEGKVNLQMSAETKEAKNLIEDSLKDLKASLGTHNLKVDHIKVDVGNQASADGSLHKQSEFKFDQGREQARNFLNNFQEDNMSNRNNFFEAPALKAYQPNKGPEPLKPSPESARSRRYVGEGRGTGLNVVA